MFTVTFKSHSNHRLILIIQKKLVFGTVRIVKTWHSKTLEELGPKD